MFTSISAGVGDLLVSLLYSMIPIELKILNFCLFTVL